MRGQIHALDPSMAIYNKRQCRSTSAPPTSCPISPHRSSAPSALLAWCWPRVGLYGVMSYAVSRRTREIGIRMALGAQPGTVERLVLRQGMVLDTHSGRPWLARRMDAGQTGFELPLRHSAPRRAHLRFVPPFLIAVALVACWIPARRAASIDPMQALRTE